MVDTRTNISVIIKYMKHQTYLLKDSLIVDKNKSTNVLFPESPRNRKKMVKMDEDIYVDKYYHRETNIAILKSLK